MAAAKKQWRSRKGQMSSADAHLWAWNRHGGERHRAGFMQGGTVATLALVTLWLMFGQPAPGPRPASVPASASVFSLATSTIWIWHEAAGFKWAVSSKDGVVTHTSASAAASLSAALAEAKGTIGV